MIDPVDSPVSAVCCQPGREKKIKQKRPDIFARQKSE
jgi:hypothetical protein